MKNMQGEVGKTLTVFGKVFLFERFRSGNRTLVGSSNWAQESWPLLLSRPTYEMSKIVERVCNLSYNSGYVSAAFVTNHSASSKLSLDLLAKTFLRSSAIFKLLWYCKHFEDYKFFHFHHLRIEIKYRGLLDQQQLVKWSSCLIRLLDQVSNTKLIPYSYSCV